MLVAMRYRHFGLFAIFACFTHSASAQDVGTANFTVHWERPTPIPEGRSPAAGFQLTDVTTLPDRSLALLAGDPPEQLLFLGADEHGIGTEVLLPRDGSWPYWIDSGVSGDLWLSGYANPWTDLFSGAKRDAYLARYDMDGNPIWERTYGWWDFRMITEVVPLQSGDLAVAGAHGNRGGWIAKLDQSGSVLWEHDIGLRKGIALVDLPDARVAAVAFLGAGEKSEYQEHVAVWIFDVDGRLSKHIIVRENLNHSPGDGSGRVEAAAIPDGMYVMSMWTTAHRPVPAEIAKIDLDGTIAWKMQLPETIFDSGETWKSVCRPSLAALPNGDAIVGCPAGSGELLFYRLDVVTGEVSLTSASLPNCQGGRWHADMFLQQHSGGAVWVVGSLKPFEKGSGCTWLGELSLAE